MKVLSGIISLIVLLLTKGNESRIEYICPDNSLIRALVRNKNSRLEELMTDLIKQIAGDLQKQIEGFEPELNISDIGTVIEAGDGIARVHGLANVKAQDLVQFANGVMGTAFNLEKNSVGVIVMGDYGGIVEGMSVRGTGRIASVPALPEAMAQDDDRRTVRNVFGGQKVPSD